MAPMTNARTQLNGSVPAQKVKKNENEIGWFNVDAASLAADMVVAAHGPTEVRVLLVGTVLSFGFTKMNKNIM